MPTASTIADVLALVTADPGRPRLTWYGDGGERVELSGAVLANWVAKTTNLLVEEFDAGPGVRVGLDLPAHWRTVTWALAAWRCGATVALGDAAASADVVVTDRPGDHAGAQSLVAVALPALARRFDGRLPAGAVDAAGAVMTYGDVIGWVPGVEPTRAALTTNSAEPVRHADLLTWAMAETTAPARARALVDAGRDRVVDVIRLLRAATSALVADGSVVMLADSVVTELGEAPGRRERLVSGERITTCW